MIWNAGVTMRRPESAVNLVSGNDNKRLGFMARLKALFVTPSDYLVRQAELRREEEEKQAAIDREERERRATAASQTREFVRSLLAKPSADPAPVPMVFGTCRTPLPSTSWRPAGTPSKYDSVFRWRGAPMTGTQLRYDIAPDLWRPVDPKVPIPYVINGLKVFGDYEVEEWNDMTEDEREELIKIRGLAAFGITSPVMDPADVHAARMERVAKAEQMKRDAEAHKRKLERELAAAEELEQHYQQNRVFGAF